MESRGEDSPMSELLNDGAEPRFELLDSVEQQPPGLPRDPVPPTKDPHPGTTHAVAAAAKSAPRPRSAR
jgi:hypothetical protein